MSLSGSGSGWFPMKQTAARPKDGRPPQNPLHTRHDGRPPRRAGTFMVKLTYYQLSNDVPLAQVVNLFGVIAELAQPYLRVLGKCRSRATRRRLVIRRGSLFVFRPLLQTQRRSGGPRDAGVRVFPERSVHIRPARLLRSGPFPTPRRRVSSVPGQFPY